MLENTLRKSYRVKKYQNIFTKYLFGNMPALETDPMRYPILSDKSIKAKGDILFESLFVDFTKFSI